jgi:hypothetical protein
MGNISDDPLFFGDDDYHLSFNSPCINAGDPNYIPDPNEVDIDGDPRIIGRIDMGADEVFVSDSAALYIHQSNIEFVAEGIDSITESKSIELFNCGGYDLNWSVINDCDWLIIEPAFGQIESSQTDEIMIGIDHGYINYGIQSCQFQIVGENAANSPQTITVTLEVLRPGLSTNTNVFNFTASKETIVAPDQILSIQNTGFDTLHWQIEINYYSGLDWLSVEPLSGQSTGEVDEVTLSVDANGLDNAVYNCDLIVSDPDAENNPQVIPVSLHVYTPGEIHVPAEHDTIQAAINAAVDGDEVIIQPGTYTGPGNYYIDFLGKAITVRSIEPENPAVVNSTIIDPDYYGNGFNFYHGEDANSVLDGLTIKRAKRGQLWGCIDCQYSSPVIRNCIVEDTFGDGIVLLSSSASISNCIIRNNGVEWGGVGGWGPLGYGIVCFSYTGQDGIPSPLITDCVISGNYLSGLYCVNSNATVANCVFVGNQGTSNPQIQTSYGGGLFFGGGELSLNNCTFSGNVADVGGGMCSYMPYPYADMGIIDISNCIFYSNNANYGPEIAMFNITDSIPLSIDISYSNVQGGQANIFFDPNYSTLNWGMGNIDVDPLFVHEPNDGGDGWWNDWQTEDFDESANNDYGDLHLKSEVGRWVANSLIWAMDDVTSLCIDAGDPNDMGWKNELWPHGKRINMGAYGGTPQASMSLSIAGNKADFNNDGFVDEEDLALFVEMWLTEYVLLPEDINRNGLVNFFDWSEFTEQWLWVE